MAMDEKGLGRRLQNARKAAGMTQQVLCQRANLSYSTLAKIERGAIKSPSIFTIQSIAAALGTTVDALMVGSPISRFVEIPKKKSKSGITFIYFDVNGCLVRFFHRAFTKLAEYSGQPADVVETAFWHYNDQVCLGQLTLEDFNKELAKHLGVKSINWAQYYYDAVDPVPEMNELVRWVGKNYRVGLLTNIMPGFVDELMRRGLIPDIHYDAIIDSSVVEAIKPETKIYNIAQKKAHCPAEEILLVDDSRANLMAAEKLGWHVLWFNDYNSEESISKIRSTLEIDSPVNSTSTMLAGSTDFSVE